MDILKYPDPSLFKKCDDVTVFGTELLTLLGAMWDAMLKKGGLGLAANQVGLHFRAFVMAGVDSEKLFIINPKIIKRSEVCPQAFPRNSAKRFVKDGELYE